jgi:carnitine O-acetyltransferase
VLEFEGYGKVFIASHGFSPDNASVQIAFQAAYFGLYGEDASFRDSDTLMLTFNGECGEYL